MLLLILLLGVIVCMVLIYAYISTNTRQWKYIKQFPGKPTLPLIGNGHQLGLDPAEVQHNTYKMWEELGRTNFRVVLGTDTFVMVSKPKDIEKVLGNAEIIDKPKLYNVANMAFGNGLVLATGHKWRTMRKLLQPAFHVKVLEKYLEIMNRNAYKLVDKLRPNINKGSCNIDPYVRNFTLDVICETSMGMKLNAQDNHDQPYIIATEKLFHLLTKRWYSVWKRIDFLYKFSSDYKECKENLKVFHGMSENIIRERKERLKEVLKDTKAELTSDDTIAALTAKGYHYFIDLMILSKMSDGSPIPDENIREEIDVLLFAGHDTTTASLTFTLLNLAKNPEIQEMVLDEQRSIFHDDFNREPNSRDINEMKYLERCIKETLRIHAPVSQFGRRVNSDVVMEDGKVIPAGASALIYIPGLYNDPDIYPDPQMFNPDRYLEPLHSYAHVSFAAGPRICIGMRYAWMEMKTTLSILLRNYEVAFEGPHMEPKIVPDVVIKSGNGINLMLRERVKDKHV